tara:strand:- start:2473 stop:3057 length:585 start_codon:yes stop_codon:yes gene_type:complete
MLSTNLSDEFLVKKYLQGDTNSFKLLLNKHKNRVFSFIFSKVKDKDLSNDIFQDALIKVINSLQKGKYNEEGKFLPWMMRITHNLIIDYFRRKSKMRKVRTNDNFDIFDVLASESKNQDDLMIRDQINNDLHYLILKLPNDQQEIVKLRYFEGYSFKKISKITGVSINTSLGRMRYALLNLRKMADKLHIDLKI